MKKWLFAHGFSTLKNSAEKLNKNQRNKQMGCQEREKYSAVTNQLKQEKKSYLFHKQQLI